MGTFEPLASYGDRGINADRLRAIDRHVTGSVLDVGCGSGAYVDLLADQHLAVGVDMHPFRSWGRRGHFLRGDATRLPFRSQSFDTLLLFETLEHLPSPEDVLLECHRLTRKRMLLTVPNCSLTPALLASNLIYHHWIDPTHINFWTLDGICTLVENAGFLVAERDLINRIDPVPLLREMLRLPTRSDRLLRWATRRWGAAYRMTSLVIAEKR